MNTLAAVPPVNFHLWQPCNMRCGFCFARFVDVQREILPKGHLNQEDCIRIVRALGQAYFEKINFAGGEPLLCPWLPELIQIAKNQGMTTSVVTNGTKITHRWLDGVERHLDWLAVSVDTVEPERLRRIGRITPSGTLTEQALLETMTAMKQRGIRLKINTVVTVETCDEDLRSFIALAQPERWKILQVLPVSDKNEAHFDLFAIDRRQFEAYVQRNLPVAANGIVVVPEGNVLMRGSYVMVDPAGRFFDNVQGRHNYSKPILDVGAEEALQDVAIDRRLFLRRGGSYDWRVAVPNLDLEPILKTWGNLQE